MLQGCLEFAFYCDSMDTKFGAIDKRCHGLRLASLIFTGWKDTDSHIDQVGRAGRQR